MKRIVCFLLTIAINMSLFVPIAFSKTSTKDIIWIEAENVSKNIVSGVGIETNEKASGGKTLCVLTKMPEETVFTFSYSFTPQKAGNYDIYMLASPASAPWLESVLYRFDNEDRGYLADGKEYRNYGGGYSSKGGIGINWQKADSVYLSEQEHQIDFIYDRARTFVNDGSYVVAMDVIAIVPSNAEIDLSGKNAMAGKAEILAKSLDLGLNPAEIYENITLPDLDAFDASVSWISDNSTAVSASGAVNYNANEAQYANLTATVMVGKESAQKTFALTLPKKKEISAIETVVLQAEQVTSQNGYQIKTVENSLAEQILYCNTEDDENYFAEFSFKIENNGTFDVWILATSGNDTWSSPYAWKIDKGSYKDQTEDVEYVWKSSDNSQTVGWSRLTSTELSKGTHTLSVKLTDYREANLWDCYYQIIDTVFLVPSSVGWKPDGYELLTYHYDISDHTNVGAVSGYTAVTNDRTVMKTDAADSYIEYDLLITDEDEYDIFCLGSENFIWSVDGCVYQKPWDKRRLVYSDSQDFCWYRLDTKQLSPGTHTVFIRSTGANAVDMIVVAKSSLHYDPYQLSLPKANDVNPYVLVNYQNVTSEQGFGTMRESGTMSDKQYYVYGETGDANLTYEFIVPYTTDYDLWLLASRANSDSLSPYTFKVDYGEASSPQTYPEKNVWENQMGFRVGWHKLTTQRIPAGKTQIYFDVQKRSIAENKVAVFDTLLLVPKIWSWEPSENNLPYNTRALDLDITGGSADCEQLLRNTNATFYVDTVLNQASDDLLMFEAELLWEGEVFLRKAFVPSVPIAKRTLGKTYRDSVTFTVPETAPDGVYQMRFRVGNQFAYQTVATLRLGDAPQDKKQLTATGLSIDNNICSVTLDGAEILDADARLEFYRDNALWGVSKLKPVTQLGSYTATYQLPQMPAGEYTILFGVEGYETQSSETKLTVLENHNVKPLANGSYYSKKTGKTHFWYVNQEGAMIWDGEPFIPMGGMLCPDFVTSHNIDDPAGNSARWNAVKQVLDQMEANGIYDLYINANSNTEGDLAAWQYLTDYLDAHGFRYGIQISTASTKNNGYYVGANVNAITATAVASANAASTTVSLAWLGSAEKVEGYFFALSAGEIVARGVAGVSKTASGFNFTASGLPATTSNKTVYFLPYAEGATTTAPNLYEYREQTERRISNFFDTLSFGDGLRMTVDPTYNETTYANWTEGFRPYYTQYNQEFATWLEKTYQTVSALNEAWGTTPRVSSFWEAAHLIPVCTKNTNTWLHNTENYKLYQYDNSKSRMWDDNILFRERNLQEFHMDIADYIKQYADIPVIYKNVAYYNAFFVNDRTNSGHDGIGNEAYGDFSRIARLQGAVNGMISSSKKTMWNVVTETNIEENITTKYNSGIISYPDKQTMYEHFNTLFSAGSKGIYDFLFNNNDIYLKAYAYTEKPEMFSWLGEYIHYLNEDQLAGTSQKPVQFAQYPANPAWWNWRGIGNEHNKWSVVSNRRDVTTPTQAVLSNGSILTGATNVNTSIENLVISLQDAPASKIYGSEIEENFDELIANKNLIVMGLRKDLGSIPCIDRYFTAETRILTKSDSYGNLFGDTVQILNPPQGAEILFTTDDGFPWAFHYGNLWIFANANWSKNRIRYLTDFSFVPQKVSLNKAYYTYHGNTQIAPNQGENTATFKLNNYTDTPVTATLILAINTNEEIISIPITVSPGTGNEKITKTVTVTTEDIKTVNYYLWDGINQMTPLVPKQ